MQGREDAEKKTFAVYFDQARELRLYKRAEAPQAGESFDGGVAGVVMEGIEHEGFSWDSRARRARRVMVVDEGIAPASAARWFQGFGQMTACDLARLDTSNVDDMHRMISGCRSLKRLDLSALRTSRVESMSGMFKGCRSLKSLDLSAFDTSGVADMRSMFKGCHALASLDMSDLDLSGVERPWGMLADCPSLPSETVDDVVRAFSGRYRRAQIC